MPLPPTTTPPFPQQAKDAYWRDVSGGVYCTTSQKLLPDLATPKPCLVLDLDETLVHSSFRAVGNSDFVIPVNIDNVTHHVYVAKRPKVDAFLKKCFDDGWEIIVYTASLSKYASPLLDLLDPNGYITGRLYRSDCVQYNGNYVKDLSILNRNLIQTIIVDNSISSFVFHPELAIGCGSFIDDPNDRELDVIGDFLGELLKVDDFRGRCKEWKLGAKGC
jgi:RNA polymerase II subunit A small phosphatase-like protein